MENSFPGRKKHYLIQCLTILVLLLSSQGLFAKVAPLELNYERLLSILSDNGWRVELSDSNQVLLTPPNLKTTQEANSWRIEQAQDGTIFLFFNNSPLTVAKVYEDLKAAKTYTFEQLNELKERLVETGWNVEQRQGNLFLYPNSSAGAVASADNEGSDNRIAILPVPQEELPTQFATQMAPPVQEIPAAASNNQVTSQEVATPTVSDSDKDRVADELDLCPKTEAEIDVNSMGCEISKPSVLEGVGFKSGSSTLKAESKEILDQYAVILNHHQSLKFKVVGYTDSTGSKSLNLDLSRSRAESVSAYLVERGISKDRIATEGQGESKPIASNKTKEGRVKNRRVELSL